jgi:hypothetical protein
LRRLGEVDGGYTVRDDHAAHAGIGRNVGAKAAIAVGAGRSCEELPHRVEGGRAGTVDGHELLALYEVDGDARVVGRGSCPEGSRGRV